jgi:uncharacterized protein YllA (UPF0747 family)
VGSVYHEYIWNGKALDLAEYFYDTPAITLSEISIKARHVVNSYKNQNWHSSERIESLKQIFSSINHELGCLTPAVKKSIENIESGVVEAAHQSVVMGGPCYILNKGITAHITALISSDQGTQLVPYYCIADYDIVQPELTNIRIPLMGQRGNLVSIPIPEGYEYSPVSVLPLPSNNWFLEVEESLRSSYNPMFNDVGGQGKILLEERLEQAISLIRWAFHNSETLGEWAKKILARLLNIEGNLGIPILPASNSELRNLMIIGMEFLLSEENRTKFLEIHNEATDNMVKNGLNPGIGRRRPDYTPFFYECAGKNCQRSRIELLCEESGSNLILSGKCPTCGELIEIEVSSKEPDLQELGSFLSPRVDSRQIILDTVIPIAVHVGGPGETAYYAQVIPIAKAMKIPFPTFVKYPRVYFNTPWNERLSKTLQEKNFPILHDSNLFSTIGKIGRYRKKERYEDMNTQLLELRELILQKHMSLNENLASLEEEINNASGEEFDKLQTDKLEIERYLSWVFGQYASGKLGQESSWSWIEWILNSGFADIFGPYQRAYVSSMKNGATLFVNFFL